MTPLYNSKIAGKPQGSKALTLFMIVLLVVVLAASFTFAFYKRDLISSPKTRSLFKDALSQVCVAPGDRLDYQGTHSFFEYLNQPYQYDCSSWTRLGNRTGAQQNEDENDSEVGGLKSGAETDVTNWHYFCESEQNNYEMLRNPCLVYSFAGAELQQHFEERFKSQGCSLHVFSQAVQEDPSENIELRKGTSNEVLGDMEESSLSNKIPDHFTYRFISDDSVSSTSKISAHPRDIRTLTYGHKSIVGGNSLQDLSLDAISSTLGHGGQRINFVRVDIPGQVWPVLAQLVRFHDIIDVHQLSAKIELPINVFTMSTAEQHLYFSELHQIFEGMNCLGYKLIRSEPLTSESNNLAVLEVGNERYPVTYQVNWMKVDD